MIADLWLPGTGGVEFLAQARECYPGAQCVLLTTIGDDAATEPLHRALALGQVDRFVEKPWRSPEEWLYPQLSEALADWWRANRPLFERVRVVGPNGTVAATNCVTWARAMPSRLGFTRRTLRKDSAF